jgi:hypothetical protein
MLNLTLIYGFVQKTIMGKQCAHKSIRKQIMLWIFQIPPIDLRHKIHHEIYMIWKFSSSFIIC